MKIKDILTFEELAAIKRVLKLVDGYLSTQDQDLALAWDGGIMTYGELRRHLHAALKTKVLKCLEIERRKVVPNRHKEKGKQ